MPRPAAQSASSAPDSQGATNGGPGGGPGKRYLCPYCGQVTADARACSACGGRLDPLSRQATQNTMGPWQVHDPGRPFRPGCSFATVRKLIERGQITRRTILRGPTTRQFWTFADRTPSVANLLGVCHNCHAEVGAEAFLCAACGASFSPEADRQYLGLAPRRPLPGEAPADRVAELASEGGMPEGPRRGTDEEDSPRRPRPAFPADPRPARVKRSPMAIVAVVAVAGVIGLSLGAAGALGVAWSVGLIDLTGEGDGGVGQAEIRADDEAARAPGVGPEGEESSRDEVAVSDDPGELEADEGDQLPAASPEGAPEEAAEPGAGGELQIESAPDDGPRAPAPPARLRRLP